MTFYYCRSCGEVFVSATSVSSLPDGWEELIPNTTDASGEKHVPVIETEGSSVTITVGSIEHPMLEAHYITWILLETNQGYQKKFLSPGQKPVARFALSEGDSVKAAYEFCNLHGLWKAEA